MKHRGLRIGLDIDIVLGRQHGGDAFMGGAAIVDEQDVAPLASISERRIDRIGDPTSREVTARRRSSSVTILRRISARTRAIKAMSDTGLVGKSSAPA